MTISWSSTSTRRTGGLPDSHGTTLELAFCGVDELGLRTPRRSPNWGRSDGCDVGHPMRMPTTHEKTWRAGRFWWDAVTPTWIVVYPLRAVIFDLDALTDIECDGHRVAYNAAFAAHGLDFAVVGRPLPAAAGPDRRAAARRGRTAQARRRHRIRRADRVACRRDLHDQDDDVRRADPRRRPGAASGPRRPVMDAFAAGVQVAVVTSGHAQLGRAVGAATRRRGLVETVVTAEDVKKHMPDREAHRHALWELGIPAENALADQRFGVRVCARQRPPVWPRSSSPAMAPPTFRPRSRCVPTSAAATRCSSRIANACTAAGGPPTRGLPHSSGIGLTVADRRPIGESFGISSARQSSSRCNSADDKCAGDFSTLWSSGVGGPLCGRVPCRGRCRACLGRPTRAA